MSWPYSELLGRALEPTELDESGVYMTIHVGGPLEGDVLLAADVAAERVSVSARWSGGTSRELTVGTLPMPEAEALASAWADALAAGVEPQAD
jgi:hypothetical protein